MSLVTRYNITPDGEDITTTVSDHGPWIEYEDYLALEGDCESLRKALNRIAALGLNRDGMNLTVWALNENNV